ncbi:hypothetical protein [Actinophytocola sp. KF-1]
MPLAFGSFTTMPVQVAEGAATALLALAVRQTATNLPLQQWLLGCVVVLVATSSGIGR